MSPLVLQVVAVLLAPTAAGVLAARALRRRGRRVWAVVVGVLATVWTVGCLPVVFRLTFPCAPRLCLLGRGIDAARSRTMVLDRHGRELAALEPGLTPWLPLESVPVHVRNAVLQREDRRFGSHRGVDPVGVVRSVLSLARPGRPQGASTVAMQAAQCAVGRFGPGHLPPETSVQGKLAEVAVGAALVHRLGHEGTLELYLNCVPMGSGRGMEAAARAHLGVGVREASVEQGLLLAAMIRAPGALSPSSNPQRARRELQAFARELVSRGVLEPAALDRLGVNGLRRRTGPGRSPFLDPVQALRRELGDTRPGTPIASTLDRDLQVRAWQGVHRFLEEMEGARGPSEEPLQALFVALGDNGEIRAYVAGRGDLGAPGYDRIRNARIQMASTLKPFLVARALEAGTAQSGTRVAELGCPAHAGDPWLARIQAASDPGLSVARALAVSDNWLAVCLLHGTHAPARDPLKRLGIPHPDPADLSTALGTGTVAPIDLARAYQALLSGRVPPVPTLLSPSGSSSPLERWRSRLASAFGLGPGRRAWSSETTEAVTSLLEGVVSQGTGQAALPLRSAGARVGLKTGTATGRGGSATERVVVGFVQQGGERLVALLWVGHDRPAALGAGGGAGGRMVREWAGIMSMQRR